MYKRGNVVLIKMHPASGVELKNFRPAIILQHYSRSGFVTFLPLSSQIKNLNNSEIVFNATKNNGLEKSTLALCWYVQTVGESRVQKKLGELRTLAYKHVSLITKKCLKL